MSKTKNTISTIPHGGVDWEAQSLVLSTQSGVLRYKKDKVSLYDDDDKLNAFFANATPRAVISDTSYYTAMTEVAVTEEYISLKGYTIVTGVNSVKDYAMIDESQIDNWVRSYGRTNTGFCPYPTWDRDAGEDKKYEYKRCLIYPKTDAQIRIYKDRSFSVVYKIQFSESEYATLACNPKCNGNPGFDLPEDRDGMTLSTWLEANSDDICSIGEFGKPENASKGYIIVESDEDVRKCAFTKHGKRASDVIEYRLPSYGSAIDPEENAHPKMTGATVYTSKYAVFSPKLRDKVNAFFGVDPKADNPVQRYFDAKLLCLKNQGWDKRNKNDGITDLKFLLAYIGISDSQLKNDQRRLDCSQNLWPTINWGINEYDDESMVYYRGDPASRPKPVKSCDVCWERRGDLIICSYTSHLSKTAFVYDVKTKIRKVLTQYSNEPISMLIPSLRGAIMENFQIDPMTDVSYDHRIGEYTKKKVIPGPNQRIIGASSFRELFDGTNIAWIMDNASIMGDDYKIVLPHAGGHYYDPDEVCLWDYISDKRMGRIAIAILATTGDPLLEQLLKNRQFNMYFAALKHKADESDHFIREKGSKKEVELSHYRSNTYGLIYDKKQKSLKKMLGMTMQQIQCYNDLVRIEHPSKKKDQYRREKAWYVYPSLAWSPEALGIESLSALGFDVFSKVVEIGSKPKVDEYNDDHLLSEPIWAKVRSIGGLMSAMGNLQAKQRMDFISTINPGKMDIYEDYFSMRDQMETLQQQRPDIQVFDPDEYPLRVGRAHKFIPFRPGMVDVHSYWNRTIDTEHDFMQSVYVKYARIVEGTNGEANKYGRVDIVKDGNALVGIEVDMSPEAHMQFLHDEMSTWFQVYHDEAQSAAFQKAVQKTKQLEWEDPEGELMIMAPTCAQDLRDEGRILSHCVASYVNPVIEGRDRILFVRRKDMPWEPFFTLDLDALGNVRQVHCYRNMNPNAGDIARAYAETSREVYNTKADVTGFLRKWAKKFSGKVNKSTIRDSYGALCAAH